MKVKASEFLSLLRSDASTSRNGFLKGFGFQSGAFFFARSCDPAMDMVPGQENPKTDRFDLSALENQERTNLSLDNALF